MEKFKLWLKKLWQEYNQFCKDAGVDQGCRGCVPRVHLNNVQSKSDEKNKD